MKKRLPNRDYAPDKLYLHRYGTLDKTLVQSKTMTTLVKFMLGTKPSNDKWKKERDSIVEYWEICTEIARERKKQSYSNAQGGKSDK